MVEAEEAPATASVPGRRERSEQETQPLSEMQTRANLELVDRLRGKLILAPLTKCAAKQAHGTVNLARQDSSCLGKERSAWAVSDRPDLCGNQYIAIHVSEHSNTAACHGSFC